jgi:spore coat protein U-like protein
MTMNAVLMRCGGVLVSMAAVLITSAAQAASCQVSASGINFGSFSPLTLNFVDSTGTITVNCIDVVAYSVALSTGNGSYNLRSLVLGTNRLDYNLYRDAAYQQVWGDGSGGDNFLVSGANPVNGQNYVYTVYGRITLSTNRGAQVGSYADSVSIIVNY